MDIPDLPPDISFVLLPHTAEAIAFAFEAKSTAMGPHITRRWAWDEKFQRDLHQRHFDEKPFYQIRRCETPVGTLSFQIAADHVRFGEFYLFPIFQGQGLGSTILHHCLTQADALRLPTRLEHLRWNPVRSLYLRHGFADVGQSDIHIFMERPLAAS